MPRIKMEDEKKIEIDNGFEFCPKKEDVTGI